MAARTVVLRLSTRKVSVPLVPALTTQTVKTYRGQKHYHKSSAYWKNASKQSKPGQSENPIAASMSKSATPTGSHATATEEDARNAAFLGEADSDDGFEADVEIFPEAHRHRFDDVNASGLHGQAGEGDEPIEMQRKPQEAVDASQSAFLGEADSDDAHEADREINPEKYRHHIDDASHAAYLGEADSDDAHEADRELDPEKYRHRIDDPGVSGVHGESGQADEHLERG